MIGKMVLGLTFVGLIGAAVVMTLVSGVPGGPAFKEPEHTFRAKPPQAPEKPQPTETTPETATPCMASFDLTSFGFETVLSVNGTEVLTATGTHPVGVLPGGLREGTNELAIEIRELKSQPPNTAQTGRNTGGEPPRVALTLSTARPGRPALTLFRFLQSPPEPGVHTFECVVPSLATPKPHEACEHCGCETCENATCKACEKADEEETPPSDG